MDIPLVRNMRSNNPYIHSALCRSTKAGSHLIVQNQIGRLNINISFRIIDDIHVGDFPNQIGVNWRIANGWTKPSVG